MPRRLCPLEAGGCGTFYEKNGKPRCPNCTKQKDHERGTRRERGIGVNHERYAKMIKRWKDPCVICGQQAGDPDNPITVGHIVPRSYMLERGNDPDRMDNLQPECRSCNLRKGAK